MTSCEICDAARAAAYDATYDARAAAYDATYDARAAAYAAHDRGEHKEGA